MFACRVLLAHLLLQVWNFPSVLTESCPALFKRYSEKHTFCLPPNLSCDILAISVTPQDKESIVKVHNELRSKISMGKEAIGNLPSASDMLQMEWDEELATVAQKHASQCNFDHDCNECREIKNFPAGQNLYQSWSSASGLPKPNWKGAIQSWYSEVKDFDKSVIKPFQPYRLTGAVGHFTQVIWAKSWRVGCGYSVFKKDGNVYALYTCNYGPAGNMFEDSVYTVGKPCGHCPSNSCCGKSCTKEPRYDGLCQIVGSKGPQYPRTGDYAYFCDFQEGSNCHYETPPGMKQWEISHTLSGSYIGIVLQGGESSFLNFTAPFKGENPMCLQVYYRKGPNVAGQSDVNEFKEYFYSTDQGYGFEIPVSASTALFSTFSMNLNFDSKFQFSLSFSVPPGQPPQYLEMKEINLKKGKC